MPNDIAFADNSALARNKQPPLRITRTVKAAIDAMVERGLDYQAAAADAGISTRNMRLALQKPHVIAYYQAQCHVLRSAARARNIHRLQQIRDADNNMPAVNAIKALELLDNEQTNKQNAPSPGVTIRIVNVTATPAQHDPLPAALPQVAIDARNADE